MRIVTKSDQFGFASVSLILVTVAFVAVAGAGLGILTGFGATVSALSNTGPALTEVGPVQYMSSLEPLGRLVVAAVMLAGRVAVIPVAAVVAALLEPLRRTVLPVVQSSRSEEYLR